MWAKKGLQDLKESSRNVGTDPIGRGEALFNFRGL